jgi:hypothetical protein
LQKKIMLGLLLLTFVLVGVKVVPGIADSQGPEEIALTLEQAVEMAIANNPQVGMAQADKKKKEISYKQAKDAGAKVEDTPMEATYEGKVLAKLKPKIAEREGEQAAKVYDITINGVKVQAENAYYNLIQAGEKQELEKIVDPRIVELRGKGFMLGIEFNCEVKELIEICRQQGLLLLGAGPRVLRLVPPLTVSKDEIDLATITLQRALEKWN